MDCKAALKMIAARSTRERYDTEALAEHLASCHACREQASYAERLSALLYAAVTTYDPPEGFGDRVAARLGTRPADLGHTGAARRRTSFATFAAGVATGLILAGIGLSLRRSDPGPHTAVTASHGDLAGTLVAGDERAEVLPPGGGEPLVADCPLSLADGSLVWAGGRGGASVAPVQGGLIRLSPDAVVRLIHAGVAIYRGTAHLDVCRTHEPFVVELPAGQMLLDQAQLSVSVDGATEDARVQIHRGCVWVGNRLGSVDLGDGQQAVAAPGAPPIRTTFAPIGLAPS